MVLDIPCDKFYRIMKNFGVEGSIPVQGLRTLITTFKGIPDNAFHPVFAPGFETSLPGQLKEAGAEDFEPGPPLAYHGNDLPAEVLKIISTLKLTTTRWTHWIHEILVKKAIARGKPKTTLQGT